MNRSFFDSYHLEFIAQIAGKLLTSVLGLVMINRLCHYLPVSAFGQYSLAFSFLAIAQPLVEFGMNAIAIREVSRDRSRASEIIADSILAKLILAVVTLLIMMLVSYLMGYGTDQRLLIAIAGVGLFSGAIGSLDVLFIVTGTIRRLVFAQIVSALVLLAAVLAAMQMNATMVDILVISVAAGIAGPVLLILMVRRMLSWSMPSLTRAGRFIREAAPQGIASIITALYFNIDMILLSRLAGAEAVAFYGAAYRILGFFIYIPHALIMVWYPMLARSGEGDDESFRSLYHRLMAVMIGVALPGCIWGGTIATPLMTAIYSPQYASAASQVLIVLLWGGCAVFVSHVTGYALVSLNRQSVGLVISIGALCLNVSLNLALIPVYGIMGAAYATVATELLVVLLGILFVYRLRKVLPLSRYLAPSVGIAGGAYLFSVVVNGMNWYVSTVLFCILCGGSFFLLMRRMMSTEATR